jgi:hypothetical protein
LATETSLFFFKKMACSSLAFWKNGAYICY